MEKMLIVLNGKERELSKEEIQRLVNAADRRSGVVEKIKSSKDAIEKFVKMLHGQLEDHEIDEDTIMEKLGLDPNDAEGAFVKFATVHNKLMDYAELPPEAKKAKKDAKELTRLKMKETSAMDEEKRKAIQMEEFAKIENMQKEIVMALKERKIPQTETMIQSVIGKLHETMEIDPEDGTTVSEIVDEVKQEFEDDVSEHLEAIVMEGDVEKLKAVLGDKVLKMLEDSEVDEEQIKPQAEDISVKKPKVAEKTSERTFENTPPRFY